MKDDEISEATFTQWMKRFKPTTKPVAERAIGLPVVNRFCWMTAFAERGISLVRINGAFDDRPIVVSSGSCYSSTHLQVVCGCFDNWRWVIQKSVLRFLYHHYIRRNSTSSLCRMKLFNYADIPYTLDGMDILLHCWESIKCCLFL